MKKPFWAVVLCAVMALALLPATAQALTDAELLQAAINGAYATGLLTLGRDYTGASSATSVSITSSLILDLNGYPINDITLHIGSSIATPAVTIKDSGTNGRVNCNGSVYHAITVHNGSLTIESGSFFGDNDNGNGIVIYGGSVTIRGGVMKGHRGIDYQDGKLTFDCVDGKTASIISADTTAHISLAVAAEKSVAVADSTKVYIGSTEKTAADLTGAVVGDIDLTRRSGAPTNPSTITAPSDLITAMSDTPAYSGMFTLAGDPPPIINIIMVKDNTGAIIQNADVAAETYFRWDAVTQRVKIYTSKLNPGVYTVTVKDAFNSVSCDWPVTIVPFDVPVTADQPAVAPNRYVIDPGDSITLTADTRNMITDGYIIWDASDLDNTNVIHYPKQNSLTLAPTQSIRCIPYAILPPPLKTIKPTEIEVYLRVTVTQGAQPLAAERRRRAAFRDNGQSE